MHLQPHLDALERDIADLAAIGDQAAATAARRLSQVFGTPLRVRLFELLGEVALELSAQLPVGHVEVRLVGPDPSLVFVPDEDEAAATSQVPGAADDAAARLTLRMPEALKTSVEEAAAREGLSVNAWIVRALARQLGGHGGGRRQIGRRLTGFARS